TYRERILLAYPGETAQSTLEHIVMVMSHELSHQWFGNLVTMKWWDDLWLNESFAEVMGYQATDALFPEWHALDMFVAAEGLSAIRRDAIAGVQPVKTAVHHPDEISSLFDPSIVYAKGGRLLRMLQQYIGDDAFRAGLKTYFEAHAYGNTEGSDLWAAMGKASGKDIASFMDAWLTRSGFPLVTATQDGAKVTLHQEHFLDDPAKADPGPLWPVPLFANLAGMPDSSDKRELKQTAASTDPLVLNGGALGHYLVRYAADAHK